MSKIEGNETKHVPVTYCQFRYDCPPGNVSLMEFQALLESFITGSNANGTPGTVLSLFHPLCSSIPLVNLPKKTCHLQDRGSPSPASQQVCQSKCAACQALASAAHPPPSDGGDVGRGLLAGSFPVYFLGTPLSLSDGAWEWGSCVRPKPLPLFSSMR